MVERAGMAAPIPLARVPMATRPEGVAAANLQSIQLLTVQTVAGLAPIAIKPILQAN